MMIPTGYMAKIVIAKPDWLEAPTVDRIYSVSNCLSKNFADFIPFWKHNGYGFFDSPQSIAAIAAEAGIDLEVMQFFYYEQYHRAYDEEARQWQAVTPQQGLETAVSLPSAKHLQGYDVVTFSSRTFPECSPLSCNGLAQSLAVNAVCLLPSLQRAKQLLEAGAFDKSEPGPFRIFSVYTVSL